MSPGPFAAMDVERAAKTPVGRVVLAQRAAEQAGDDAEAERLRDLYFRHVDGEITDEQLDRLAGTTPAETSAA